jgi:hypothetical protein
MSRRHGGGKRWIEQGAHLPGAVTDFDTREVITTRQTATRLVPTSRLYSVDYGAKPEVQAARRALQGRIRDKLFAESATVAGVTHPVAQDRQVWIVMGNMSSGKTTIMVDPLATLNNARIIDADGAKELLPEYDNGHGAGQVHRESVFIATDVTKLAMDNGDNLVLPMSGKSLGNMRTMIEDYKRRGYTVHMALLDLPVREAQKRSVARMYGSTSGRLADPALIGEVGDRPSQNFDALRREGRAADYVAYSNDVPFGEPAIFLPERSSKGMQAIASARAKTRRPVSERYSMAWFHTLPPLDIQARIEYTSAERTMP